MKQIYSFKYNDNMDTGKLQAMPYIRIVKLKDDIERYYIDSYPNLYRIINERFKEQKKKYPEAEPIIDLSNVVICLGRGYHDFWIGKLCGNIEGIKNLGGITIKNEIQFEVRYKLLLDNSIIYGFKFYNTKFYKHVSFSNTKLLGGADFDESEFLESVNFVQTDISQISKYQELPTCSGIISFEKIIFPGDVYFQLLKWTICNNLKFNDNTYEGDVHFILCSITDLNGLYYDFTNSNFKGDVLIDSRSNSGSSTAISHINFNGSHFHKKLKIFGIQIGHILMINCHFDDTVNISQNDYDITSHIDFSLSTIDGLFFMDSYFGEEKGIPFNLSDEISFKKSLITKDAFVFFRNINPIKKAGTLDFSYANILGTVTIQDSKLKLIKLDKSTIIGDINIEKVETDYDSRESIAKVKNSYLKRNDVVNSLDYKAKEMKFYSDSLSKCFSCKLLKINKLKFIDLIKKYFMTLKQSHFIVKKLWSFIKFVLFKCILLPLVILPLGILLSIIPFRSLEKVREYTLLYLNRISNSFGMSWGQGVLFTCVTAWIFFVLINYMGVESSHLFVLWQYGWGGFGDVWQNYLRMFYLTKFEDVFNTGIKLNVYGETLFFVSKIFVSYGIYQTISAFRKYGK